MSHIPYIEGSGKLTTLYVDGKPFHARSGEIHNSSSSSLDYMEAHVWPALRPMHLNCVVAPIYWECVEPQEGVFDFTLIDGLIAQARREGVKLVFLWFGLWKNAASTYVPEWVKVDHDRFWYVQGPGNKPLMYMGAMRNRIISPLCAEGVAADARAYAAVMQHLAETDGERTVITMQVENEIGVLGADRDYSPAAEEAFAQPIPAALAESFGVSGCWAEAFGADAAEMFMAWHYAQAVEQIVRAGKAVYPLPMYVNAWLEQAPWTPGSYPSGGPQFKMYKVWKLGAPSVDFYAPDIYVDYFRNVCDEYASEGNPLFIPEVRQTADTVAFYLYAVGKHNAMCFAPFGIEDMMSGGEKMDMATLALLNISAEAMKSGPNAGVLLGDVYQKVANMEDLVEQAHREGRIRGFLDAGQGTRSEIVPLSKLNLQFSYGGMNPMAGRAPGSAAAGGLVIELGDYEFVVLAVNCSLSLEAKPDSGENFAILSKEEGTYVNGQWVRGRILNGDEQYRNSFGGQASFLKFKLDPYC